MSSDGAITALLAAVKRGDPNAESDLAALVYNELRAIARRYMRRERGLHTLQPTALVHETYLRLMRSGSTPQDRAHFYATAATMMRRILVDHARRRRAEKRGGGQAPITVTDSLVATAPHYEQLLILDQALTRLAAMDARQAHIVELLYFGGLTEKEVAAALEISDRTVKREWSAARAWLQVQLTAPSPTPAGDPQ